MKAFSDLIRETRKTRRITLKEAAKKIGVSITYLSDIENGRRNPPEDKLSKIAECFSLNIENIIDAANKSRRRVEIDLDSLDAQKSEVALVFGRKFSGLSADQVEEIWKVINKDSNNEK